MKLQAARTDKVSTRQNGAGAGSNGAILGADTADRRSSNGSTSNGVVQGTDLQERPYSNNGNGASYRGNGNSYSKQGSAGQRREAAVADALEDAAAIDIDAEAQPQTLMMILVHLVTLESVLSAEVWTWSSKKGLRVQHLSASSKQLFRMQLSHPKPKSQAALGAELANTQPSRCSKTVTAL